MKKILIVEDDSFLRELMVKKIANSESEEFEAIEAVDGEDAMKKIRESRPDIVLLDLMLPGIDGFEVLSQIKHDIQLLNIPVIILSNLGQKEEIEKGMELGAVDYLVKAHFTTEEIINKVKAVLR